MDSSTDLDPRIERTRAVVVRAAADLLVECGFERITIEAIAERSGVARSTIYRNWPSRADLLVQAFDLLCAFDDVADVGSLEDELRALGRELAHGLTSERWGQVLPSLVGAAAHDHEIIEAQRAFSLRRRELVGAVFARAMARGDIPHQDALDLAEQFAAGFFFRRLMSHLPLDEAFIERQVRAVASAARG